MIKLMLWPDPFNKDPEMLAYVDVWKDKMHMHGYYFIMPYCNPPIGPFQKDQLKHINFSIEQLYVESKTRSMEVSGDLY